MFTSFLNKLRAYVWRGIIVFVAYFSLVHIYTDAHIILAKHEGSHDEHYAHYLVDATFTQPKIGKAVRFIGMRHIADEHFYKVVSDILK